MRGIGKSFAGVAVLTDVDLSVAPGEVVALLGSNGAGKSTMMKILSGLYSRDAGEILIDGHPVSIVEPRQAVAAGIRLLPQEISVMPDMTVAENILLGDLPTRSGPGFRTVDDRTMSKRAAELLTQLGFGEIDPAALVGSLSLAERRIVEIARALAGQARILIMDEPTASLTEQEAEIIFRIIRRLKEQRAAVIYISHYLKEVFAISDRIVVLRDGRNVGDFATRGASPAEVVAAMLGSEASDLYDVGPPSKPGVTVLSVDGLSVDKRLHGISLDVAAGEIVGVFGLVGSGIETLGRAIYGGLGQNVSGRLTVSGRPYVPRSPRDGKAVGIGFVAADRKKEGIIADLSVRENMVAAFPDRYVRGLFVSEAAETAQANSWIRELGIRTRGPEQEVKTLSGGNQQKVCVSRWLVDDVRVLILEEPTRGVDVGARHEIYRALRALTDRGLGVLALSSDVEEVAGISDRSVVIDRGRVADRFPRGTPPAALMAATAIERPSQHTPAPSA
jgi:ribose transport system ATP-binding protein